MAKTILVVDDQPEIVELVERILELEGYQVVTSPNGNALQHLQNPLPDLILLDVFLPDGDGRTFCSQVKKQATTRHIPVLLFSAHLHIRDQWKESGADALLIKPFRLKEFLDVVTRHLEPGQTDASLP